jgi:hypothetical protein
MREKMKVILNKIICDKLNLRVIEEDLANNGIKSKIIQNKKAGSHFFFLMNDIYLDRLSVQELNYLQNSISQLDFSKLEINKEFYTFLISIIDKLLLPETTQKYLYWGKMDYDHMAPSDSIVLAFHYEKYGDEDDEKTENQEKIINNNINYIQEKLGPLNNLKVSVIVFDEITNVKSRVI